MSNETPKGFDRATGVVEGRRKCLAGACGKIFPVKAHDPELTCPHCGSDETSDCVAQPEPRLRIVRD